MEEQFDGKKKEVFDFVESLVEQYQARLRAFVFARVRNKEVADDLVQEVFLIVVRRNAELDRSRDLWPWLAGIAKNKLFEYWRSRKKEIEGDALESALIDAQMEQESIGRDAEWREHRLEALKRCMDQLDGAARDIVRMTYVDRLRSEQLAEVLKRKAAGVRVTLFRLREQLLHCIERCLALEVTP